MRVFWADDRRRFLRALGSPRRHRVRVRAEMLVLLDTGARVSELRALDVADYDPQRGSLLMMNCKAKDHPRREVPLHPVTNRALRAWLRDRAVYADPEQPALFVSQKRARVGVRTLQDDYERVCADAGIAPRGIHTLRHSAITYYLDERILEPHQVARRVGHRGIQTMHRYYVHGSVAREATDIRRARFPGA